MIFKQNVALILLVLRMIPKEHNEEDSSVGSWFRKKSRRKKIQNKWSSLYFVPLNVINYRRTLAGQTKKGPRAGNQLFRDLTCRDCGQVFHSRQIQSSHYETFHIRAARSQTSGTETKRKYKGSAVGYEEITIDDDDDSDGEVTCIEPEAEVSLSDDLKDDDEVTCIEPELEVSQSDDLEDDSEVTCIESDPEVSQSDDLKDLSRSAVFQPKVSLRLSLTKAMRKAAKDEEEPGVSRETSTISDKLVALFSHRSRSSHLSSLKKKLEGWTSALAARGTKRQSDRQSNSRQSDSRRSDSRQSDSKQSDSGQSNSRQRQTFSAGSEKSLQSPLRKKPFRPVSLLNKFNAADDSAPGGSVVSVVSGDKDKNRSDVGVNDVDIVTLDEEVTEDIVTLDENNPTLNDSVEAADKEEEDLILVSDSDSGGEMDISRDSELSPHSKELTLMKKFKTFSKKKHSSSLSRKQNIVDFIDVF